jgi:peptidoglycan/LPS O-acetylase OafA/YrhL
MLHSDKNLNYIDALRGVAILLVIGVHTTIFGAQLPSVLYNVFQNGARGVQLFFMISAFTLFFSLEREGDGYSVVNFYIRRFLRIAPLYYVAICYFLFQDGFGERYWLGDMNEITVSNIVANLFFLHGINAYWINSIVPGGWSIAVEAGFYIMFPFLFSRIKSLNTAVNFFLIGIVVDFLFDFILIRYPLISSMPLWNEFLFFYLPNQLPVFALGIILYYVILKKDTSIAPKQLLLFSILMLAHFATKIPVISEHVFFTFAFFIFTLALSRYSNHIVVNIVTVFLGRISYSLYFVHFAVIHWWEKMNVWMFVSNPVANFVLNYLVILSVSALISFVLFTLVEEKFRRLGKILINRRSRVRAEMFAYENTSEVK